jgi:hypothetical protein
MADRSEAVFINEHADALSAFWNQIKNRLLDWRAHYQWPTGAPPEASLNTRTQLEQRIRADLHRQGSLTKAVFDAVIRWGFGSDSGCSDQDVQQATRLAFRHLKANHLAEAARELIKLPRVGISRASKILALSDQGEFGIYDSRSGHGLSDLVDHAGRRLVAIPPGRVITGDPKTKDGYCRAFEEYTWVLRYFRTLALEDASLRPAFSRVADLEMAFFMRSRSGQIELTDRQQAVPEHLRAIAERDEENVFWTLGPGSKSQQFWAILDSSTVTVLTGKKKTPKTLTARDIDNCLEHFEREHFPLSNTKTTEDRDPLGLGEYFAQNFGSSVFASHFAALWVHQGRLEPNLRQGAWWFRVNR